MTEITGRARDLAGAQVLVTAGGTGIGRRNAYAFPEAGAETLAQQFDIRATGKVLDGDLHAWTVNPPLGGRVKRVTIGSCGSAK